MAKGLTWTIDDADHMTQAEIYGEVLTQLGAQNEKIIALTDQLSCLHVLTHLDNGRANPIPILT